MSNRIPFREIILYYPIYYAKLIRGDEINKIIIERLTECNYNKNKINVDDFEVSQDRPWILDYLNKVDISKLNYDIIIMFDGVRACLRELKNKKVIKCIWVKLNTQLNKL